MDYHIYRTNLCDSAEVSSDDPGSRCLTRPAGADMSGKYRRNCPGSAEMSVATLAFARFVARSVNVDGGHSVPEGADAIFAVILKQVASEALTVLVNVEKIWPAHLQLPTSSPQERRGTYSECPLTRTRWLQRTV